MKRSLSTLGATLAVLALACGAQGTVVHRVTILTGDQETPPNASTAIGSAVFRIDTCANTLEYRIAYSCLGSAETAAHIHGYAPPGVAAGVVHPLPAGSPKVGVWTYPEADEAAILDGRAYVNIHTAGFGGGEIRGQIVTHVAFLDAATETPPNASPARGYGLFMMDTVADTLRYHIAYAGLTTAETAAHIHGFAIHGTPAGVVHPLPSANPKTGTWNYPAADEGRILDGQTYVNIHTMMFPGGEIRGQISSYISPMDPLQEVPPNPSTASGRGILSLDRAADQIGFDIAHCGLTSNEVAAHFHGFAAAGANAGVVFGLPPGTRKLGVWPYPAANEAQILGGLTYLNVHSAMFGGGEIRGQNRFPFIGAPCPGDFDGNGVRDLSDLALLLGSFGGAGGPCNGDMDGNGIIELVDLAAFLALFGTSC